jgi:hypothetical protein
MRVALLWGTHRVSKTTTAYNTPTATPEGIERSRRKIRARSTMQAKYNIGRVLICNLLFRLFLLFISIINVHHSKLLKTTGMGLGKINHAATNKVLVNDYRNNIFLPLVIK